MSHDLISNLKLPQGLATLTMTQLVDIIVQQQQLIEQLQQDESDAPTQGVVGAAGAAPKSTLLTTQDHCPSQPLPENPNPIWGIVYCPGGCQLLDHWQRSQQWDRFERSVDVTEPCNGTGNKNWRFLFN